MSRLGLVPELTFAEQFKQLRRDIVDIKSAQLVGRDILRPKLVECLDSNGNPTAYDLIAIWEFDDYGGQVRLDFAARFQADHQAEPWATPLYKMMYGDPSVPATAGQTYGFSYPFMTDMMIVEGEVTYHGWFGNNITYPSVDHTPIYLKVYFLATDTGVLTVTAEDYV